MVGAMGVAGGLSLHSALLTCSATSNKQLHQCHSLPPSRAALFCRLPIAPARQSRARLTSSLGRTPSQKKASLEGPSRPDESRSSDGSIQSSPGWGVPSSRGMNGRRSAIKVEGVGVVDEEGSGSQRVRVGKAAPKVVIMVDPVEAKRLAAAEMKAMQARAKLKSRKEIEAINGGWAVLGLTAGIVIDGYTGKSILIQIAGYLDSVTDFLKRFIPS